MLGWSTTSLRAQFTDGLNVEFGKNRVQHRTFEWQYFEQGIFEVYHYREGDQIAGQVARILEEEAKDLGPMFGRTMEGPVQVLVFKSQEEFRQSNVGIMTSQDQETNTARSPPFRCGLGEYHRAVCGKVCICPWPSCVLDPTHRQGTSPTSKECHT